MKNLIKANIFALILLLSACGGQGIEVSNPTPSIPTQPPKKVETHFVYGFMNIADPNGLPAYKLIFLRDNRIALQTFEQFVTIQSYSNTIIAENAKMAETLSDPRQGILFSPMIPGKESVVFSMSLSSDFNLTRFTVTDNNELVQVTYENYLGAAQQEIAAKYEWFNQGTCQNFSKTIQIEQKESEIRIRNQEDPNIYYVQMQSDGYLNFTGDGKENNWVCEGAVVKDQFSGVCIPDRSEGKACTFFFKKIFI